MRLARHLFESDDDDSDLESLFNNSIYQELLPVAAQQFGFKYMAEAPTPCIRLDAELSKPIRSSKTGRTYTHVRLTAGIARVHGFSCVWFRVRPLRFDITGGVVILKPGRYAQRVSESDVEKMEALFAYISSAQEVLKRKFTTVEGLYKALRVHGFYRP